MIKINLHQMFEARMNQQAERPWGFEGTSNREAAYYRRGYTAALNDLQGKIDGLTEALESIKTLDGKAQNFNKKYMRCASCTSVEIAMDALAEFKNGEGEI